jgi:glycosyltransferase involved in cell wall biosynthesis
VREHGRSGRPPKVALVHDWLTGMRGGEKVLLSLARLFPEAPIYALVHVKGSLCPELEARQIRTSFLQAVPGIARHYRRLLPLFPAAVGRLDLRGYDLVVSSSHCVAKGVRTRPGTVHLCYCHTPMRYVWDRFDDYFGPGRLGSRASAAIALASAGLRAWDVATAPRVHRFIANSRFVAGRIRRYYGRACAVVPPPVDAAFFTPAPSDAPGSHDLVVSALVPYKRLELVIEAYRGRGRHLKIVGTGPEQERLKAIAPAEVEFAGSLGDEALRAAYRDCRVVVMIGIEDFGIVPLEAMACGRPVIVYGHGGGPESVVHGQTGLHLAEMTPSAIRDAVDSLSCLRFNRNDLRARAMAYDRPVFEQRIRDLVAQVLGEW